MMSTTTVLIALVIVVALGAILAPIFVRQMRSKRFHEKYGPEYDRAVKTMGGNDKAQVEMGERQKHVDSLIIRPLTDSEQARYSAEWQAVQSKFVDEPGQAIVDADRLIMEVMQLRGFPLSDFEQRAADISINYPDVVANYRAARDIALKNRQHKADTEELRTAVVYYRSLFDELLKTEPTAVKEN